MRDSVPQFDELATASRDDGLEQDALHLLLGGLQDAVHPDRIGDCLEVGLMLRDRPRAIALRQAASSRVAEGMRTFSLGNAFREHGTVSLPLGPTTFAPAELRAFRSAHQVRAVGVVIMPGDFVHSPSELIRRLDPMLASEVLLVVCGKNRFPTFSDVVRQLEANQQTFSVLPTGTFASSWIAVRLSRCALA